MENHSNPALFPHGAHWQTLLTLPFLKINEPLSEKNRDSLLPFLGAADFFFSFCNFTTE